MKIKNIKLILACCAICLHYCPIEESWCGSPEQDEMDYMMNLAMLAEHEAHNKLDTVVASEECACDREENFVTATLNGLAGPICTIKYHTPGCVADLIEPEKSFELTFAKEPKASIEILHEKLREFYVKNFNPENESFESFLTRSKQIICYTAIKHPKGQYDVKRLLAVHFGRKRKGRSRANEVLRVLDCFLEIMKIKPNPDYIITDEDMQKTLARFASHNFLNPDAGGRFRYCNFTFGNGIDLYFNHFSSCHYSPRVTLEQFFQGRSYRIQVSHQRKSLVDMDVMPLNVFEILTTEHFERLVCIAAQNHGIKTS